MNRLHASWLAFVVAVFCGATRAAEPARLFLEGLRERNYYDMALEYLEQMANSPLAPVELKETLLYEKGLTLIEASRFQKDPAIRTKQLDEAQQLFTQFVTQRSDHPLANTTRSQLGNLSVERARLKMEAAKKGDKAKLQAEARKLFDESYAVFGKLREDLNAQLARIPKVLDTKDKQQAALAEKRDLLRSDYLQALLLSAMLREEMAETVAPGSKESNDLLADAAKQFNEIYELYRTRLAGLYARMYQGRCMQKMKKHTEAIGFLTELLDQPTDNDAFRVLICKSLRYAMESWLDPSQKKFIEALKRGDEWIEKARANEEKNPDWLAIRMLLIRGFMMQSEELKKANANDKNADRSLTEARKHANYLAKFTNDYQKEAQSLIAVLGGPDRSGQKQAAKNFAEAKTFSKDAIDAMQAGQLLVRELPKQLALEKDAAKKAELQKRLDEATKAVTDSQLEALEQCRVALRMVDSDTELADLNFIRYLLCFLSYSQANYFDAALIGEFVAKRYPDSSGARQCAKIAMASYLKMYEDNKTPDKKFESDRIVSVAEFISKSWPEQPEAEEALSTLVPFMINAGELQRALDFVAKIPESSAKRGQAELETGRAMWNTYKKQLLEMIKAKPESAPAGTDVAAKQAELDGYKSKAMEVLKTGYDRVQSKPAADKVTGLAFLAFAQVYVESQQPLKAIEVLEHAVLGPLTMVEAKHPAAQDSPFIEETYKLALQAYIAAIPVAPDRVAMQKKAQATMEKLKAAVGADADGQKRLNAVFISLARSLEEQLKVAQADSRKVLAESFETFLKQIRTEAKELNVLAWVAETFVSLGSGFDNGTALTAESKHFYEEADASFEKILKEVPLQPQRKTEIQIRQAHAARRLRDFKKALAIYKDILTVNNMLINVQVEAARAYQEWGSIPKEGSQLLLERSYRGSYPDASGTKNIVWGWDKISTTTSKFPQFIDSFHEANVNRVLARVAFAEKADAAKKTISLDNAMKVVTLVYNLYPELGGVKWKPQYEAALKKIQQAKGESPVGLKALPQPKPQLQATPQNKPTPSAPPVGNPVTVVPPTTTK